MLAKVYSAALKGYGAYPVEIEVDLANGLPGMIMVGLPDTAIQESRERVRSALKNSGYHFPLKRITINLAPANTRKSGPVFDLAIAIGILVASEQLEAPLVKNTVFLGELSLDGSIRPIHGALNFAITAAKHGITEMILPPENAQEAASIEGINVYTASSISEVLSLLNQTKKPPAIEPLPLKSLPSTLDFSDIRGQTIARRGMEVAAAGGHHILLIGPPGSGKTMLARRMPSILPPLNFEESLETSQIYSSVGPLKGLIQNRPFRSPHHSISPAGLTGGSSLPKPGEISLSHHGILFLDELLEFERRTLELLRQPLEEGEITLSRAKQSWTYPAKFMLIAAFNPCPCGFLGDSRKSCQCNPHQIQRYRNRLSGPLKERIDIQIEVPRLPSQEILSTKPGECSQKIRQRVLNARQTQALRFNGQHNNAQMNHREIQTFCRLKHGEKRLLKMAIEHSFLSARSTDKVLKIARTIADLDNSPSIQSPHLTEALQLKTNEETNTFK